MQNRKYRGFVAHARGQLNPLRDPNCFYFSGFPPGGLGNSFACILRVIIMQGSPTPEQFSADIHNSDDRLPGTLETFPEDYDLGIFTYVRANGTKTSARADNIRQISPELLQEFRQTSPELLQECQRMLDQPGPAPTKPTTLPPETSRPGPILPGDF